MSDILSYYGISKPPFLEITPLRSREDISCYFSGRTNELAAFRGLNTWGGKYAVLLTGSDGVGKTTLLRRILLDCPLSCYIKGDDVESLSDVGNATAEFQNADQSSTILVAELPQITKRTQGMLVVVLDGQDFLRRFDISAVATCCEYIRALVPQPATFIYSSRDPIDELKNAYHDARSRISRTFDEYIVLQPFGINSLMEINDLLIKRFHMDHGSQFPFSEKSMQILEQFASGNLRELLRNARKILQAGYQTKAKVPLEDSFCAGILVEAMGSQIENEVEFELLSHLMAGPMAVADLAKTKKFGSERTVRRALERLEERRFVVRDHSKPGIRQEFSLLDKAELLLLRRHR